MAMVYSQTLLMLWFLKNGILYIEMLFYFLATYLFTLFLYLILQEIKFSSRSALLWGVASSAAGVFMANFVPGHTYYIFLIAFFFALNLVFFWTIYNALYFKYSEKEEHGFKSGIYFVLFPVLGAILSPLSGMVVEKFGYHFLFSSAMLLYAIPLVFAFYLPKFKFEFKTLQAFSKVEHPMLVAFQGYIFMLTTNIIPIFTLFFISTPLKLGNFFGYLAILAALAALFNAKMSDKLKKRGSFFYIFTSLNALSFLPLVFFKSFLSWQIFTGVNNFTYNLTSPFNMTLTLDHAKNDMVTTMLGRQIYFHLGSIVMIVIMLLVFYFTSSLWSALIWSAFVPLLYPVVAYYNRVYLK